MGSAYLVPAENIGVTVPSHSGITWLGEALNTVLSTYSVINVNDNLLHPLVLLLPVLITQKPVNVLSVTRPCDKVAIVATDLRRADQGDAV